MMRFRLSRFVFTLRLAAGVVLVALAPMSGAPAFAQAAAPDAASGKAPVEIKWDDLIPKGWDPYKDMKEEPGGPLLDGTPRAQQKMRDLRAIWDNAPTNSDMNGRKIKLPGYVVPLQDVKEGLTEFLLVPYFGACIHTPPPPANQIVHVTLAKPLKGYGAMDVVWVSGVIKTARQDSEMGTSGYQLKAEKMERYTEPARR